MQACCEHVEYQLPNEHTRVTYLLDGIECSDAPLQAALALVEQDDKTHQGARHNFEKAVVQILPKDPVVKRRLHAAKRPAGEISMTDAAKGGGGGDIKKGIGQSGVHLRYHEPTEYDKLSKQQKKELAEWRLSSDFKKTKTQRGKRAGAKGGKGGAIAAAVNKQIQKMTEGKKSKTMGDVLSDKASRAYIMSLFEDNPLPSATPTTGTIAATSVTQIAEMKVEKPHVQLSSILKKAAEKKGNIE